MEECAVLLSEHVKPSRSTGCLIIRTDASREIGTGHFMRCLSLAQAWQDKGRRAIFITASEIPGLKGILESEQLVIVRPESPAGSESDALETAELTVRQRAKWVVVDGYQFPAEYHLALKERGLRLLQIDDVGGANHYYADIVLNQNLYAHEQLYTTREPNTKLLLGLRYVLLRREFIKWRRLDRHIPDKARRLLVTLGGGGDEKEALLRVITSLRQIDNIETRILLGGYNDSNVEEVKAALRDVKGEVQVERKIASMPDAMAWADLVISGAGSTCWELAFMGTPALVLILAENQRRVAESLESYGVVENLGWQRDIDESDMSAALSRLLSDPRRRREMSEEGRKLIDGQGALRVVSAIEECDP